MGKNMWNIGLMGVFVLGMLLFGSTRVHAFHESFDTYESWSAPLIRADRWVGTGCCQIFEMERTVHPGGLVLRTRVVGGAGLGPRQFLQNLNYRDPSDIDQFQVTFEVAELDLTGCDSTQVSTMDFLSFLSTFNDGSSTGPNDATGDHGVNFQTFRTSNMAPGVVGIRGLLNRCGNPACSGTIPFDFVDFGQVTFDQEIQLTFVWDQPNHQYVFQVNDGPAVARGYGTTADTNPAVRPEGGIGLVVRAASCSTATTAADATIEVLPVLTNTSAIVP